MRSRFVLFACVSISAASAAGAQWPAEDVLLDCALAQAADPSLALEAWTPRLGPLVRYGWLFAGPHPSSRDYTPHAPYARGPGDVFRDGGVLSTRVEWRRGARAADGAWPRRLRIGAATEGPPGGEREFGMHLLDAHPRRGRARVAVTQGPLRMTTDVVDRGYVGECRIVRGRRAIPVFESIPE